MTGVRPKVAAARWLLGAVCVALLLTAGMTAYAMWRAAGLGLGAGKTGTAVPVTLSPGTPAADLHPGGRTDVLVTVTNPNPFTVRLGALALDLEQGQGGFGYDPLFIPNGFEQSFAELGEEVKNQLSHRSKALAKLKRSFQD